MCETINTTSEMEATISSQESQSPPIQRQVEQSTSSQAVEINITEPFPSCGFHLSKKLSTVAIGIAHFYPSIFRNFPGCIIMRKVILSCVSFACSKMQNQISVKAARSKGLCFISKRFSNWEKALARYSR